MNYQIMEGHDGFFYACFQSESDAEEWMKERNMNLYLWCAGGFYNAIRVNDIIENATGMKESKQ